MEVSKRPGPVGRPSRRARQEANAQVLPTPPTRKLQRSSGASRNLVKVPEGFEQVDTNDFYKYAYSYKGEAFDFYACNSKGVCIKRKGANLHAPISIDGKEYRFQDNMKELSFYLSGLQLVAVKELRDKRKQEENHEIKEEEKRRKEFMNTVSKRTKITEREYIKYIRGTNLDNGWTRVEQTEPSSYYRGDDEIIVYYVKNKQNGGRRRSRGFMASLKKVFGMTRRVRRT